MPVSRLIQIGYWEFCVFQPLLRDACLQADLLPGGHEVLVSAPAQGCLSPGIVDTTTSAITMFQPLLRDACLQAMKFSVNLDIVCFSPCSGMPVSRH